MDSRSAVMMQAALATAFAAPVPLVGRSVGLYWARIDYAAVVLSLADLSALPAELYQHERRRPARPFVLTSVAVLFLACSVRSLHASDSALLCLRSRCSCIARTNHALVC